MRETTSTPEQISNQVQLLEKELTEMKRKEADLDRLILQSIPKKYFKLKYCLQIADSVDYWNSICIACKQTHNLHITLT